MRRPLLAAPRGVLALVLSLLLPGGCGLDASQVAFPGTIAVQDPAGGFLLRVQSPPWEVTSSVAGDVKIEVPARVLTVTVGSIPTYTLEVKTVAGNAPAMATQRAQDLAAQGLELLESPQAVSTASGDAGTELVAFDKQSQLYERDDYFQGPAGAAYHLQFGSIYDLRETDIGVVVDGFQVLGETP
jgi:hypothetical protein